MLYTRSFDVGNDVWVHGTSLENASSSVLVPN